MNQHDYHITCKDPAPYDYRAEWMKVGLEIPIAVHNLGKRPEDFREQRAR